MEKITSENFETEVLNSEKPVLLEFYSDGCIPCKMLSPLLGELEEKYSGIKFAKTNTAFAVDLVKKYNIEATPTIVFFNSGEEFKRTKGFVNKNALENAVREVLE